MGKYAKILKLTRSPLYYLGISKALLVCNFLFQRILRLNADIPFSVHYTSKIQGFSNMELSESAKFSMAVSGGCYFTVFPNTTLRVGRKTIFAPNIAIQTGNHDPLDRNKYNTGSIFIGENCWIGFGAVILAGVSLGDNVTVGANSVVTKSFPDNVIIAGCPAVILKHI